MANSTSNSTSELSLKLLALEADVSPGGSKPKPTCQIHSSHEKIPDVGPSVCGTNGTPGVPVTAPECSVCKAPASLHCQACAYNEEMESEQRTRYCGKVCQQNDWHNHKTVCHRVAHLNQIYRAAVLVQGVYYKFRRELFDLKIDGIECMPREVLMWYGYYGDMVNVPFPDHLLLDQRDKEAVLSYCACEEGIGWMHHLFKELLEGMSGLLPSRMTVADRNQELIEVSEK